MCQAGKKQYCVGTFCPIEWTAAPERNGELVRDERDIGNFSQLPRYLFNIP